MACWKSARARACACWWPGLLGLVLALLFLPVRADTAVEAAQFRVDRAGEDVALSVQLRFELPPAVEDALRNIRLAYQPLTGQWRLNVASGLPPAADLVAANAPSQTFASLAEALVTLKQFARWRVGSLSDNDPTSKYRVEFRFWLDTNQLPRPFQIGVMSQNEWTLMGNLRAALTPEKSGERWAP